VAEFACPNGFRKAKKPGPGERESQSDFGRREGMIVRVGKKRAFLEKPGGPGKDFPDSRPILPFKAGDEFVSDSIPEDGGVPIRRILMERNIFGMEKCEDIPLRDIENRPDEAIVFRSHGGEALGSRSSDETDKNRFRLVVLGMGDRDRVEPFLLPNPLEEAVTDVTEFLLVLPGGVFGTKNGTGDVVFLAERPDEELILVGVFFADPIVHMRDTETDPELFPERKKYVKQGDAVRSTGTGDQNGASLSEEAISGVMIPDAFDERPSEGGRQGKSFSPCREGRRVFG